MCGISAKALELSSKNAKYESDVFLTPETCRHIYVAKVIIIKSSNFRS